MLEGTVEQTRLSGIDCPKKKQPYRTRAKQLPSNQAFRKQVIVQVRRHDRDGRTLALLLPIRCTEFET